MCELRECVSMSVCKLWESYERPCAFGPGWLPGSRLTHQWLTAWRPAPWRSWLLPAGPGAGRRQWLCHQTASAPALAAPLPSSVVLGSYSSVFPRVTRASHRAFLVGSLSGLMS